jgi:hypothetical protein
MKSSKCFAIVVTLLAMGFAANADCQEAASADQAAAEQKPAEAAPAKPQYIKPRRGPAPTLDRLMGIEYQTNPDGTMERHVEIAGQPAPGLEDSPPESESVPALPLDPSYTPPERATVGSINDEPPADEQATAAKDTTVESSPRRDYSLVAGAGVCVAIGLLLWWTMREPRKSD